MGGGLQAEKEALGENRREGPDVREGRRSHNGPDP